MKRIIDAIINKWFHQHEFTEVSKTVVYGDYLIRAVWVCKKCGKIKRYSCYD